MSIGQTARALIIANPGMKSAEILDLVKAAHPEAKTTVACIAWYKNDIKKAIKQGKLVIQAEPAPKRTSEVIRAEIQALNEELEVRLLEEEEEAKGELERIEAEIEELKAKHAALSTSQA